MDSGVSPLTARRVVGHARRAVDQKLRKKLVPAPLPDIVVVPLASAELGEAYAQVRALEFPAHGVHDSCGYEAAPAWH